MNILGKSILEYTPPKLIPRISIDQAAFYRGRVDINWIDPIHHFLKEDLIYDIWPEFQGQQLLPNTLQSLHQKICSEFERLVAEKKLVWIPIINKWTYDLRELEIEKSALAPDQDDCQCCGGTLRRGSRQFRN